MSAKKTIITAAITGASLYALDVALSAGLARRDRAAID